MPKPNVSVVNALFETYLSMRKDTWKLEDLPTDKLKLPDPSKELEWRKIETCAEILRKVATSTETQHWIAIADMLYKYEIQEQSEFDKYSIVMKTFIYNPPVLLDLLRAVRHYIISSLSNDKEFTKHLDELTELQKDSELDVIRIEKNIKDHDQTILNNAIAKKEKVAQDIASLRVSQNYLNDYFVTKMPPVYPNSDTPKEKDVNEFILNAAKDKHPATVSKKLLASMSGVADAPANKAVVVAPVVTPAPAIVKTTIKNPVVEQPQDEPKTPEMTKTTTRTAKSAKQKSALRTHSQFAPPETLFMSDDAPLAATTKKTQFAPATNEYNTRSKSSTSRVNKKG